MALDRGTKIYAGVLLAVALGLVALALYEPPLVRDLNHRLETDPQLAGFPYPFRVLRVENGVATMTTPRNRAVPVARVLGKLFPEVAGADPASPRFQAFQEKLASAQKRAMAMVMKDPQVKRVQWELDRDWLMRHGIPTSP